MRAYTETNKVQVLERCMIVTLADRQQSICQKLQTLDMKRYRKPFLDINTHKHMYVWQTQWPFCLEKDVRPHKKDKQ